VTVPSVKVKSRRQEVQPGVVEDAGGVRVATPSRNEPFPRSSIMNMTGTSSIAQKNPFQ
jgi:hypothetical protein